MVGWSSIWKTKTPTKTNQETWIKYKNLSVLRYQKVAESTRAREADLPKGTAPEKGEFIPCKITSLFPEGAFEAAGHGLAAKNPALAKAEGHCLGREKRGAFDNCSGLE